MSCEFYRKTVRKARKPHRCDLCRSQIEIGETYFYESGKFEGSMFENHVCNDCNPLQEAFFRINRNDLDGGYTWDNLIDDINGIVCDDCRKENGDCEFGYNETPQCNKAQKEYVEFAKS